MKFDPRIFKAYDIRGLYPDEINESIVHQIGRGLIATLKARRIGVSRDMRTSSPSLASAFIEGALEQGADVVDYGMLGTDMLYFAVARDALDAGAQITASHNPKQYNGIKMVREDVLPLSGETGIGEIRDLLATKTLPRTKSNRGTLTFQKVIPDYIEKVMSFVNTASINPFRIVLDAGSGMAGLVAGEIFDRLPCVTTKLCFDIDGTFPNHEANPLLAINRKDITDRVISDQADIGIAWDGDADRCFFIDEDGEFVPGDFITALLAESFLLKEPGSTIVYDLRASHAVRDTVTRNGGTALMNRVGHAFIKRRMREEDCVFGGEVTGHYYFRDFYYADNGFIPALLILDLMSKRNQSLRDLLKPYRETYFISGEINTKIQSMDEIEKKLSILKKEYSKGEISDLDGISIDYPDWHFNVRPSNTEPLLRLNLEADTPALMEKKRDEVLKLIQTA